MSLLRCHTLPSCLHWCHSWLFLAAPIKLILFSSRWGDGGHWGEPLASLLSLSIIHQIFLLFQLLLLMGFPGGNKGQTWKAEAVQLWTQNRYFPHRQIPAENINIIFIFNYFHLITIQGFHHCSGLVKTCCGFLSQLVYGWKEETVSHGYATEHEVKVFMLLGL